MIEKEFIPYEQALALKELGFDEPCFGYFNKTWSKENELLFPQYVGELENWNNTQHLCSAPTFSQAFRWFREKYDLIYVIVKVESWFFTINGCNTQEGFNTYEEAELACLRKLIELIKRNDEKSSHT